MTVRCERHGGVAHLVLARPDAGNAIDLDVARALADAATALSDDRGVRVVLLRSEGKDFCVGGDLRSFAQVRDLDRHLTEVTTHLHAAIARLARLDAPVIAAVQGSAAGAGMSLALGADLVVAAASARFVLAYTRVALSPDGGGSWYLPRLVGTRRALELALTNRALSAGDALEWGLVTRVVPDDALRSEAEALAGELAAMAPGSLAATKRLMRASLGNPLETQLELESLALAENARRDGPEGIAAFIEKRPPAYPAG
ncbi:MAG TPA: enoyl-CoA hydratase-related protein [Acidimicrobiales bacterium]